MAKTRERNRFPANGHVAVSPPAEPASPPLAALPAVAVTLPPPAPPLRLDIGCGPNPREGFEGADVIPFGGKVKHVVDLRSGRWPWADGSVAEVHSAHFLEHLTNLDERYERVNFFNELYRVLTPVQYDGAGKPVSGFAVIVVPHWASQRFYGDPSHKEPISEFAAWYLDKGWRAVNAPHTDAANVPWGYACDFLFEPSYTVHPTIPLKHPEAQQFALTHYLESRQDLVWRMWRRPA